MITTVTENNMVSIPRAIAERYGIEPGWKLNWTPGDTPNSLVVHLIPSRGAQARQLRGLGRSLRDTEGAVEALVAERETDLEPEGNER